MAQGKRSAPRWSARDTRFVVLVMAFGVLAAAAGVAFAVPGPGLEHHDNAADLGSAAPWSALTAPASR